MLFSTLLAHQQPFAPHPVCHAGALASQLGIPRAAAARNAASYYGSDAETLSSRDWSEGAWGGVGCALQRLGGFMLPRSGWGSNLAAAV